MEDYCLPFFLEDGYPFIDDIKKAILAGEPFLNEEKPKTTNAVVTKALDAFARGKTIKSLSLRGHKGAFPKEIFGLQSLETLDIRDMEEPPPSKLGDMPNLKEIIVKPSIEVEPEFVTAIGGFSCLERLTFKGPGSWFSKEGFDLMTEPLCRNLGGLRQLTSPMVTDEMLQLLPNLEVLLLKDCGGGTTFIKGGHPKVTKLVIERSSGQLGRSTNDGYREGVLENLNPFLSLEELHISGRSPGKPPPEPLNLPYLKKVSIRLEGSYSNAGPIVRSILACLSLESLELAGTELKTADFKGLEKCQNLKFLKLEKAISTIDMLLYSMVATRTKPSSGLLASIKKLSGLKKLEIIGHSFPDSVENELKKALPKCRISIVN